jgi:hypothetical protein
MIPLTNNFLLSEFDDFFGGAPKAHLVEDGIKFALNGLGTDL